MKPRLSLSISDPERNDNHMNVASSDQLQTELVKSEQLLGEMIAAIREKVPQVRLFIYFLTSYRINLGSN